MRGQQRDWTTTELARLKRMVAAEMPQPRIATRLGRTVSSVRHGIRTAGIAAPARPKWSDIEDARLRKLLRDGLSVARIESEMGRTRKAVRNRMSLLGLTVTSERMRELGAVELAA